MLARIITFVIVKIFIIDDEHENFGGFYPVIGVSFKRIANSNLAFFSNNVFAIDTRAYFALDNVVQFQSGMKMRVKTRVRVAFKNKYVLRVVSFFVQVLIVFGLHIIHLSCSSLLLYQTDFNM